MLIYKKNDFKYHRFSKIKKKVYLFLPKIIFWQNVIPPTVDFDMDSPLVWSATIFVIYNIFNAFLYFLVQSLYLQLGFFSSKISQMYFSSIYYKINVFWILASSVFAITLTIYFSDFVLCSWFKRFCL